MTPGYNCKQGSAWHDWQKAGAAWRIAHPDASKDDAYKAACRFAAAYDWGRPDMRVRAFMECANGEGR